MWLKETLKSFSKTLEKLVVIGVVFVELYTGLVDVVILFVVGKTVVCALGLALRLERSAVVGLADDIILVGKTARKIQ